MPQESDEGRCSYRGRPEVGVGAGVGVGVKVGLGVVETISVSGVSRGHSSYGNEPATGKRKPEVSPK